MSPALGIAAVVVVTVATVLLGGFGLRMSRTTSDFLVASRTVRPLWNASAIGGEYLSAASFLGIAGLVMAYGADMLWYPVGYAAGYLMLLLLIAAPLRRSGAYTIPDFAEARLASRRLRRVCSVLVIVICWLYTIPQLQGAGLTLQTVTGAPSWLGAVVVTAVVTGNAAAGGMRSITLVQAFQYWLKLTAITIPAIVLLLAWRAHSAPALTRPTLPSFPRAETVSVQAGARFTVPVPVTVLAHGQVDASPRDGRLRLSRGIHTVGRGTTLRFPAGAAVPHVAGLPLQTGQQWALPLTAGGPHPLYATYSLVLATFLGTMGLPHVLVRFYTNPDGSSARRTTLLVLVLLGAFYLMPALYGALGRLYAPDLFITGRTDAVVLVLPTRLVPGLGGQLLAALVTAGAFAAFLSTTSGLVVSVAGVLVQDIWRGAVHHLRRATLVAGLVPLLLTLRLVGLPVSEVVSLAFAVAASSFCPLLVLGIWWRRLTDVGAAAGLLAGGGLSAGVVIARLAGWSPSGWGAALVDQPAAWSVPIAFATMVIGSLLTPTRVPSRIGRIMVGLHAPDALGMGRPDQSPAALAPARRRPAGWRRPRPPAIVAPTSLAGPPSAAAGPFSAPVPPRPADRSAFSYGENLL